MNPVTGLSLGRIGIGALALTRPDLASSILTPGSPANPLLTRWFGSREIALGAATLLARGGARRSLVLIGVAVDGADAATAYASVQDRSLPRNPGLGTVAVAAGAAVAGLLGLRVRKPVVLEAV
jgi:hypothetical protein